MKIYHLGLQELPLFEGLTNDEMETFVDSTRSMLKRVKKGDMLLQAYDENHDIGVIVEGTGQILSEDCFGNEVVSHTIGRGALFGSTSAILPGYPYAMAVQALTDVLVLRIPYRSLLTSGPKLGKVHGIVMKHILEAFCWKNILMMQRIELLSKNTLRERLIIYLLYGDKLQAKEQVSVPGRVQLAKELECNRSALTREINAMKQEGMLEVGDDWMRLEKDMIR